MKPVFQWLALASLLLGAGGPANGGNSDGKKCQPLVDDARNTQFGLAVTLAGGGTKAASFGMGVLSALTSEEMKASGSAERGSKLAIAQTGMISTVSGGSYAGYFLYSRLIDANSDKKTSSSTSESGETWKPDSLRNYFTDCIPNNLQEHFANHDEITTAEAGRRGTTKESLFCPPYANAIIDAGTEKLEKATAYWNTTRPETLHQQFLRCHQDVLAWQFCNFGVSDDGQNDTAPNLASGAVLVLATGISLPFAWTANFIFDWPVNLSPSRVAYRDGIGMAFGLRPQDARALQGTTEWAANVHAIAGAKFVDDRLVPDASNLNFAKLRELTRGQPTDPPLWVINATAAPSRHLLGWLGQNDVNLDEHIFHMSGQEQCAESVGPIPIDHRTLWDTDEPLENLSPLLSAVNASAAFFDANEQTLGQPARFLAGVGLQASNLNWGIDLINLDKNHRPRVGKVRERVHESAPFPLYLAESASAHAAGSDPVFVRLVDGGSSDNLGAYGPIVGGVRDIIVSDHSQDAEGSMGDLCYLHNELYLRRGLHLHIPGLTRWPEGCLNENILRRSRNARNDEQLADKLQNLKGHRNIMGEPAFFYPIWGWPYPFLAACVSPSEKPSGCLADPVNRLWIVKPAFDYPYWLNQQTRCQAPGAEGPGCHVSPAGESSRRIIASCGSNDELPCESSAVLLRNDNYVRHVSDFDTPEFPQGSTVKMTFNSSANIYGAYRELARHYTRQAIQAIDRVRSDPSGKAYERILCWQGAHPIRGSADSGNLKFLSAWGDIRTPGWGNDERAQARLGVGKDDTQAYIAEVPDCARVLSEGAGNP